MCAPDATTAKALNNSSLSNVSSHTNIGKALKCAGIKYCIWSDIHIVANSDFVSNLSAACASDVNQILDHAVLSNLDLCSVSSCNDSVPERRAETESHVTYDSCIWGDPVSLETYDHLYL